MTGQTGDAAEAVLTDEAEGHTVTPDWVLLHPCLPAGSKVLYGLIKHYARGRAAFPSRATLGKDLAGLHGGGRTGKCCPKRQLPIPPGEPIPNPVSVDTVDKLLKPLAKYGAVIIRKRWQSGSRSEGTLTFHSEPGPGRSAATSHYHLVWTEPKTAGSRESTATPEEDNPGTGGSRESAATPDLDESDGGRKSAATGGRKSAARGGRKSAALSTTSGNTTTGSTTTGAAAPPATDADGEAVTPPATRAERMLKPWWDGRKANRQLMPTQGYLAVRGVIATAIGNRGDEVVDDLLPGLDRLVKEGRPISGGTLQVAISDLRKERGVQLPSQGSAPQGHYEPVDDQLVGAFRR